MKTLEDAKKHFKLTTISVVYKVLCDILTPQENGLSYNSLVKGDIIHPNYQTGSGRRRYYAVYFKEVKDALDFMGIQYTVGNDSPRGGVLGEWIKVKL